MSTLTAGFSDNDWQSYARQVAWPTIVMGLLVTTSIVTVVVMALMGQMPYALATVALTALTYWAFTIAHEAGHGNIHGNRTGLRWIGDALGYVSCISLFIPFPALRAVHNMHHAHSNHPAKDPDYWVNVGSPLKLAIRTPLIVPHYFYQIFKGPLSSEPAVREIRGITLLIAGAQLVTLVSLVGLGYGFEVLMLYILPALLASGILSLVFDWIPHYPYARQGRFKDTRIIIGRGLDWLTCGQSYHLVHHAYPRIPFYLYKRFFHSNHKQFEDNGAIIEYAFDKRRGVFSDKAAWELPLLPTEEWIDATLVSRTKETPDAVSIVLELPGRIDYRPGQYMAVRGWIDGVPVDRCYSLVSVQGRNVEFGIKAVPNGRMSNWLNNAPEADIRLQLRGPVGDFFVAHEDMERPKLILAGGSGITPTLAIATDVLEQSAAPVLMIYTSQQPAAEIFGQRLDALQQKYAERLQLIRVYDNRGRQLDADELNGHVREWLGTCGFEIAACEAFMCGPVGFMDMADSALSELGVVDIHREAFVASISGATALAKSGEQGFEVKVEAHGETRQLRIRPGANLLSGLLEAGVKASYGCGSGMCGTCMCQLQSGSVEQKAISGLTQDEAAAGKILPCSSVVVEDSHFVL